MIISIIIISSQGKTMSQMQHTIFYIAQNVVNVAGNIEC